MFKFSLLLCAFIGLFAEVHSEGCLQGWLYGGGVYRHDCFSDHQHFADLEQDDFSEAKFNSYGVQGGFGVLFPLPFFVDVEGGYTSLCNSHFSQTSIVSGETSFTPSIKLDGHTVNFSISGAYLFEPLCETPWSIFPLVSYNFDQISITIPHFPISVDPNTDVVSLNISSRFFYQGPAIGFGTTYTFFDNLLVTAEADWEWRKFKNLGRTKIVLTNSTEQIQALISNSSSEQSWMQGPRVKLGLDYFFWDCWFIGVSGEWLDLRRTSNGRADQNQSQTVEDLAGNFIQKQTSFDEATLPSVKWTSWQCKLSLGCCW